MLDECDFDDDDVPGEEPDADQGYLVHLVPARSVDMRGYWCVVCMRFVPIEGDGVMVHDNVAHPPLMTFDDDRVMQ
jgi:hypothetical protein